MKERYYVVFIVLGLALLSVFVFADFNANFAGNTFVTKGTIASKQVTSIMPVADGQEYCYNITCTNGNWFEIKNSSHLSNCTNLYNCLEENATYTFTTWFDTNTGTWNIIDTTKVHD